MRDSFASRQHLTSGDYGDSFASRQRGGDRSEHAAGREEDDAAGEDANRRSHFPATGTARASTDNPCGATPTPAFYETACFQGTGQLLPANQRRELLRAWRILPQF
jgi:hypothetical protein